MKSEKKNVAAILVLVLSLSIPTVSIYLCYVDLAGGNFHSFHLTFQNLDEENVTSDYRDDLDRCESQGLFDVLILQTTLFGSLLSLVCYNVPAFKKPSFSAAKKTPEGSVSPAAHSSGRIYNGGREGK